MALDASTVKAIICAIAASTGFWTFISAITLKRMERNDAKTRMILGLGHDRIVQTGMIYIERGWITKDEYEDFYKYLYRPYKEMGGNGSAERIAKEVDKLKIVLHPPVEA